MRRLIQRYTKWSSAKANLCHRYLQIKLVLLLFCAVILVLAALLAPYLVSYDPYAQDLSHALQAPSNLHWAGTDQYGRDLFSRVVMGAQISILSTLCLVLSVMVVGMLVGMLAGWYGGVVDTMLMRCSDIFLAFPGLVFALAIAGVLGGSVGNAVLALIAIAWPKYARLTRGLTLTHKQAPYMHAARLSGCGTAALLFRHVLPNIGGALVVTAVLDIGTMLMELAALSFLGLGAQPPAAEWGSMMNVSRNLLQIAPWTVMAPGIAICITVVVFNLLGDTLRDWMDPVHRGRGLASDHRGSCMS